MFVVKDGHRSLTINDFGAWKYVVGNTEYTFDYQDIEFLSYAMEQHKWRNGIEDAIDDQRDYIDFTSVSEEQFIGLCLDEIKSLWELSGDIHWSDPDYFDVVYSVANDNEIWSEDNDEV